MRFSVDCVLTSLPPPVRVTLPVIVIGELMLTVPVTVMTDVPEIVTPSTVSPSDHEALPEIVPEMLAAYAGMLTADKAENTIASVSRNANVLLSFIDVSSLSYISF